MLEKRISNNFVNNEHNIYLSIELLKMYIHCTHQLYIPYILYTYARYM